MGRHEAGPVGSGAREATAQPWIGKHRAALIPAQCCECARPLSAAAGFCDLIEQPAGSRVRVCSMRCLHAWAESRLGYGIGEV